MDKIMVIEEIKDKWLRMPNKLLVPIEAKKDIEKLVFFIEDAQQKLIKLQHLHCIIKELWTAQYFVCFAEQESLYKKLIGLKNILEALEEE